MALKNTNEQKQTGLSLDDFKKQLKKSYGKDIIIDALEKESYGDVIPCTSFSLRSALGIGGFPKNKLVTIDGEYSSGKSTTGYDIIGQAQKTYGDRCLLIDKEDSYSTSYGELLGIDNEKLDIITPTSLEDMYDILVLALKNKLYGVILVDSVTAFAPETRHEGSIVLGVEARVNSDKMRLVVDALHGSNTSLIFIMQTRSKLGCFSLNTNIVIK